jgi:PAS domain S-box-containing protein
MCNPTQCRYVGQASDLVLSLAPNGAIRGASPDAARTLGHDPSRLCRKSFADLVAPDHRRRLGRIMERCRTDLSVRESLSLLDADGRRVPVLCCFQRLAMPGGHGAMLVTGVRLDPPPDDVRCDSVAVLGQLTFRCHGPAHRLMQAVETLLMQHPGMAAAEQCRQELDRLLEVISLAVAQPPGESSSEEPWTPRPVNVVQTVESALRLLDHDPRYADLEIQLRPERPAVWATAHPVGLVFIALHLASNARDATRQRKSGRLLIDIYPTDVETVLEFKDNGAGLEAEALQCVFAPCLKTGAAPPAGDHAGMGLATCSELLHQMGGKMRLQSRPAKGTTVVVTLPPAAAPRD